ncbi:MAG: response regulator transcription factor [Bacillota bacterium]|nr:response regulator transcription factor [Bacillota bacterium]
MRILLVEDETALSDALAEILTQNNYTVDVVHRGPEGLDYASSDIYDMILLDIMLPGMDGLTILRSLRQKGISTPVILLTAKSEVPDIITGLDAGSDDYLAKPFSTGELLARMRALSRRGSNYTGEILSFHDLTFNKGSMELGCNGSTIRLGLKEAQLIELLLKNTGQVMPKNLLIEKIWGIDSDTEYNNIEVYISFLRQKLNFLDASVQIKTIRGVGYQLEAYV